MVKIVSVESGIGGGKTTMIDNLMKHKDAHRFLLVKEPVDLWMQIKNKAGEDVLSAFYRDKHENALPLQLIALLTRRQLLLEKIAEAEIKERETKEEVFLITERTVRSDYYIFAKSLNREGHINEFGMIAYSLWNNIFSQESNVSATIYLKVEPEECARRIKNRNRPGEENIPLEYLQELYDAHEEFYAEEMSKGKCFVCANQYRVGTKEYELMIDDIVRFILEDTQVKVESTMNDSINDKETIASV